MAGVADLGLEEGARQADQNAGAVSGLAVCVDCPAMPDGLQRLQRQFNHLAAGRTIDGGDEADAAGVPFGGRVVGVGVDQLLPVGGVADGIEGHAATLRREVSQASISAAAS